MVMVTMRMILEMVLNGELTGRERDVGSVCSQRYNCHLSDMWTNLPLNYHDDDDDDDDDDDGFSSVQGSNRKLRMFCIGEAK